MKKREKLTFAEHVVIGETIKRARDDLAFVAMSVHHAYGEVMYRKVAAVEKAIERLRCDLDSLVCGETAHDIKAIGGLPIIQAYYGKRRPLPLRDGPHQGSAETYRAKLRRMASALNLSARAPNSRAITGRVVACQRA